MLSHSASDALIERAAIEKRTRCKTKERRKGWAIGGGGEGGGERKIVRVVHAQQEGHISLGKVRA